LLPVPLPELDMLVPPVTALSSSSVNSRISEGTGAVAWALAGEEVAGRSPFSDWFWVVIIGSPRNQGLSNESDRPETIAGRARHISMRRSDQKPGGGFFFFSLFVLDR
jgi:hypothetical protein